MHGLMPEAQVRRICDASFLELESGLLFFLFSEGCLSGIRLRANQRVAMSGRSVSQLENAR